MKTARRAGQAQRFHGEEILNLDFQAALIPAKLGKFLLLGTRQLRRTTRLVDLGLGHPVPRARLGNTQILRQLSE
jgi:hypothetical protein